MGQAPHWDQVTAEVVVSRCAPPPETKFFTEAERSCASALLDHHNDRALAHAA